VFIRQERVDHHCAACEAGEPHEHGAGSGAGTVSATVAASVSATVTASVSATRPVPVSLVRGKVIVPASQDVSGFREAWEAAVKARRMSLALPALYEELGDSKRAGQEHQAWRGIEGKAVRQKARS
jgi:hypothetical protein